MILAEKKKYIPNGLPLIENKIKWKEPIVTF